jgi:transcriptional regulator with GAF, ATPase, and Fis domain
MGATEMEQTPVLTELIRFFQAKRHTPPGDREYNAEFCRLLRAAAGAEEASIWQLDLNNNLHLIYSTDISEAPLNNFTLKAGEGIAGAAALSCKTLSVQEAWRHPAYSHRVDDKTGQQTRSMVSAPIVFENKLFGVLNVLNLTSRSVFPDIWRETLSLVAVLFGSVLAQAGRLHRRDDPTQKQGARQKKSPGHHGLGPSIVGISRPIQKALHRCLKAGGVDIPVLIRGETGTGKELAARRIHEAGPRSKGPFLAVNCAALTETLLESELFGHIKGAFTGAIRNHQGKFLAASGGTLFLDEVSEISFASQAKLLRALEEKKVTPVGADRPVPFDARIIAATNQDLTELVSRKRFREDLFYRLCGIEIVMPPLRERIEDVPLLAAHFLKKAQKYTTSDSCLPSLILSPEALDKLVVYSWPGNVRQLEQAILAAVAFCEGDVIQPVHFPPWLHKAMKSSGTRGTSELSEDGRSIDSSESERSRYLKALNNNKYPGTGRWNLAAAAREIGIPRKTLTYRLKRLGIME